MTHVEVIEDIKTLIVGEIKAQADIVNKYLGWGITDEDMDYLTDGEILDIVYDITREAL
jgi:hypothetical protein